ncbi:hypothetical protein [Plantactinospora mayteni]|nr:hypothetical protein [Plantactinospora mayteni]
MTWIWTILVIALGVSVAAVLYVALRDRQRLPSAEDSAASRLATSDAARHDADRHVKKLDNGAGI